MLFAAGCTNCCQKPAGHELYSMPSGNVQTRWYTYENPEAVKGGGGKANHGRKGAPWVLIPKEAVQVLADIRQPGTIRRIWATLDPVRKPETLRGLQIEMYWDDAPTPAVRAPFGDFFCQVMGQMSSFESAYFSSPEGRSFNCFVPMPFRRSARIQIVNETDHDQPLYYEIDCTLNEKHDNTMLYFHSYWRRENMTKLRRDMTILPKIRGRGRFLGCNIGVRLNPQMENFWWGEGEVKIYLDGDDEYPTLCGTGAEDYVGTGYGQGKYSHRYQGSPYVSSSAGKAWGFYRFHIPDPVYFYEDIRVTLQVLGGPGFGQMLEVMDQYPELRFIKAGDGTEHYTRQELESNIHGSGIVERTDDYSVTAYWYMDRPSNDLPPIAEYSERIKDLSIQ